MSSLSVLWRACHQCQIAKNVYLEVTYAEDVVKGDTTSSVLKDPLETGAVAKVPAFIKVGDIISVDTSTGEGTESARSNFSSR